MGTWGHDSFSNDDALDWLAELEAQGLPAASGALAEVERLAGAGRYLEAPACAAALAAAEVVAALRGRPAAELPGGVTTWVAANPGDPGELLSSAQRAVDAVLTRSELRELWEESASYESWHAIVTDLRERLS